MCVEKACREIAAAGYTIIEGLLDPTQAARLDKLTRRFMRAEARFVNTAKPGYLKLEGALNHLPALAILCAHPVVLQIAERLLGTPFYLPNNICTMWCQPQSAAGGAHADWPLQHVPEPYPPWPMLLQTMWMLSDFTSENGATRMVPGSHLSGKPAPPLDCIESEVAAVGTRGSILIWSGNTWHRNGPNTTTDQHRMGANVPYIPSYLYRPPEAWPLLRRDLYESFPPHLQQLLERSVAAS